MNLKWCDILIKLEEEGKLNELADKSIDISYWEGIPLKYITHLMDARKYELLKERQK